MKRRTPYSLYKLDNCSENVDKIKSKFDKLVVPCCLNVFNIFSV